MVHTVQCVLQLLAHLGIGGHVKYIAVHVVLNPCKKSTPATKQPTDATIEMEVFTTLQYSKPPEYKAKMLKGMEICVRLSFSRIGFWKSCLVPEFWGFTSCVPWSVSFCGCKFNQSGAMVKVLMFKTVVKQIFKLAYLGFSPCCALFAPQFYGCQGWQEL